MELPTYSDLEFNSLVFYFSPGTATTDITRLFLLNIILEDNAKTWIQRRDLLCYHMENSLGDLYNPDVKRVLVRFTKDLQHKFTKSRSSWDKFKEQNKKWLEKRFDFGTKTPSTPRTNSKRTEDLIAKYSVQELSAALEEAYRKKGLYKASEIVGSIGRDPDSARLYVYQEDKEPQDELFDAIL